VLHLHLCTHSILFVIVCTVLQSLAGLVNKCLTLASGYNCKSIVFPALGTGNLRYPPAETAHIMLDTINNFLRTNPSTSLNDVRVIVYQKDANTYQVMKFSSLTSKVFDKTL
jgi:O-acetyl-ADP-ribose deacetylase (regulator of RNase III)